MQTFTHFGMNLSIHPKLVLKLFQSKSHTSNITIKHGCTVLKKQLTTSSQGKTSSSKLEKTDNVSKNFMMHCSSFSNANCWNVCWISFLRCFGCSPTDIYEQHFIIINRKSQTLLVCFGSLCCLILKEVKKMFLPSYCRLILEGRTIAGRHLSWREQKCHQCTVHILV